jgi:hypothetical protein
VGLFKGGEEIQAFARAGERYLGGTFGSMPGAGVFTALDMKTNRIVWQQAWRDSCYSGSVTTAGGLVFIGRNDGRFTALNSSGFWNEHVDGSVRSGSRGGEDGPTSTLT